MQKEVPYPSVSTLFLSAFADPLFLTFPKLLEELFFLDETFWFCHLLIQKSESECCKKKKILQSEMFKTCNSYSVQVDMEDDMETAWFSPAEKSDE